MDTDTMPRVTHEVERPFGFDELFFSSTDRRGFITSGNDVFRRVSGYADDELFGRPHNIVRHRDMPRAAFRLVWTRLLGGSSIAAYVKNRAKDGTYYWVMASIVPTRNGGFLSVRFKPSSPVFAVVRDVYATMRAAERSIEDGGGTRSDAIAASTDVLLEQLSRLGFDDYDSLMNHALPLELRARQERVGTPPPRAWNGWAPDAATMDLVAVRDACEHIQAELDLLFADLDGYAELGALLDEKSTSVLTLAEQTRLASLNATISSGRLGPRGATLGVVAGSMRTSCEDTAVLVGEFTKTIADAARVLGDLGFRICLAKLQTEMVTLFVDELLARIASDGHGAFDTTVLVGVEDLAGCLDEGVARVATSLGELHRHLGRTIAEGERLRNGLATLDTLAVGGTIEAAHVPGTASIASLFRTTRRQVSQASEDMGAFVVAASRRIVARSDAAVLRDAVERVRHHVDRLTNPSAA